MNKSSFNLNSKKIALRKSALFTMPLLAAFVSAEVYSSTIEELVVSARKRGSAEQVQDVPIAVTAFNGETLEKRGMVDLTDVGMNIPNVNLNAVGTLPGTANFFIRGMGVFGSIPSDETTVGVIVDGVYLGVNAGALTNLFDMESIEVLRGPQGTLFGRNVTGGAIVLNSKRPTEEFEGKIKVGVGNYDSFDVNGMVSGSLTDTVQGRFVVGYSEVGDYFDNVAGPDRGEKENIHIRPSISFKPTDTMSFHLIGEYHDFEGDGVISKNLALTTGEGALDDFEVANDLDAKAEYETKQLTLDWDWQIGPGDLKIISAWRDTDTASELDADGMAVTLVHSNEPWRTEQDQISIEARYFLPVGDSFDTTFGLYYFDQSIDYTESRTLSSGDLGAGGLMDHDSWALFSQSNFNVTSALTVTAGLRYTSETKDVQIASFGECDGDGTNCNYLFQDDDSWSFVSAYLGGKWQVTDDTQSYLSWTRSFRSGGFNLRNTNPNSPGPYDEERVDAYEVGVKSDLFEGKVRSNVAAFINKYTDLQRTILSGESGNVIQVKENVAEATIRGVEWELNAYLTDNFRTDLSLGWIDAEYDSFEGGDPDLDFANVPETNASLALNYQLDLSNGAQLEFIGSASYTDEQWATDPNDLLLDSYTVVNGSIIFYAADQKTKVRFYVKNATDEEYTNFALQGLNTLWGFAPPRTYGISYERSF